MTKSSLLAIGIAVALLCTGIDFGAPAADILGAGPIAGAAADEAVLLGKRLVGVVREVTAYNVGVREQTSDDPCTGARGHDLCEMVAKGRKVCAANFVSLGTILRIEGHGECVVLDRMNRRYPNRVDIAMAEHEVEEAQEFGLQRRLVAVKD